MGKLLGCVVDCAAAGALAILWNGPAGFAQVDHPPILTGYITSVTSSTNVSVNRITVIFTAKTQYHFENSSFMQTSWIDGPYIGLPVKVFGKRDRKNQAIYAREVVPQYESGTAKEGFGIIDHAFPSDNGQGKQIVVRADGFAILIDGNTRKRFIAPLASMADINTNVWIEFKGQQASDGHIVATQAVFTKNAVEDREDRLRNKNEYNPATVDPEKQQGAVSKAFLGTRMKRIPPYLNPTMQTRIDRIGASLVPAYQLALPASDPTKINFRFHLIDVDWKNAVALPSGIVLVPRHVVEKMQNDAQLAAVLASALASSLEKRDFRDQPAMYTMQATGWATLAGGAFVPGLGWAGLGGNAIASSVINRHDMEQSARVSLELLQDAQYDIYQAPIAWWVLASSKPKELSRIPMPEHTQYLYQILGTTWRTGRMAVP